MSDASSRSSSSPAPSTALIPRRPGPWIVAVALIVLGAVLIWRGYEFYSLGLSARVEHDDYQALRPSGLIGHGYGIVGTFLILTNLLYLARRRFARWRMGSMRWWLDLHVFSGLGGGMLVLFHSAFQARTPIAVVTSASLVMVVLTGVIGRYLYALSARSPRAAAILKSWRGFHRLLAILLVLIVPAHIAVSLFYGYRWIFSE